MTSVSVILPTYNEADNIVPLVEQLLARIGEETQVIVVDDDSPDGTAERATTRFAEDPRVRVIRRVGDRGLARSIQRGLEDALGPRVVVMDADFNHQPESVPLLLAGLAHADLVIGSRFLPGGGMAGRIRYLGSRGINLLARALLGTSVSDHTGGFFAARTDLLRQLPGSEVFHGYGDYFFRLLVHALRAGARVAEVPVRYPPRAGGASKTRLLSVSLSYSLELFRIAWKERVRRGS